MRAIFTRLILIVMVAGVLAVGGGFRFLRPRSDDQVVKRPVCSAAEYRQFDFWIGDWDTFEFAVPDKNIAHNRVESILDGCALHEIYEQGDGLIGESFTIYDASRRVWHQSWVTNRGQLLVIEGGVKDNQLVLTGNDHTAEGKPRLIRAVWTPVEKGVREIAEVSIDGGKTWKPHFDIVFRTHSRQN